MTTTKTNDPPRTDTNSAGYTDAVNDHISRLVETDHQFWAAVRCADDVTPTGNPAEEYHMDKDALFQVVVISLALAVTILLLTAVHYRIL